VHEGVGMLDFGSAPYFAGSMMNFLDWTNETDGSLPGCLTPTGPSPTIYHAKPVVIQGAWLAGKATQNFAQFKPFQSKMQALLSYWDKGRRDPVTGLYTWYDQLESGCDNLPVSLCPSKYSPECWSTTLDSNTLASSDVMTFLHRESAAYELFLQAWKADGWTVSESEMTEASARTSAIHDSMNTYLWNDSLGVYVAYNKSTRQPVLNRVFLMGFPVMAGLANTTQAGMSIKQLLSPDMMSVYGVRSTSSMDPRYTNANMINPYSNWRGPMWVISNVLLSYGMVGYGYSDEASAIAQSVVATLAGDLNATSTWHECYDSETGAGLAAPGFLSWNTLAANWERNLASKVNPFEL